jgi:hypothetical protein
VDSVVGSSRLATSALRFVAEAAGASSVSRVVDWSGCVLVGSVLCAAECYTTGPLVLSGAQEWLWNALTSAICRARASDSEATFE